MLGFYPDDAGKKWRNLDVQVNRPDVTLRFRRGYQLGAVTRPPKNKDPMVGFSASVLPKTDLPLKMFATVLPSRGRTSRLAVTLQVRVPRAAVWRPNLGNAAVTGIELLDERRTVLRSIHQEVKPLTPGRVDVSLPLTDLGPGAYRIRVAASTAAGEANREIGFLIGALSERRRP